MDDLPGWGIGVTWELPPTPRLNKSPLGRDQVSGKTAHPSSCAARISIAELSTPLKALSPVSAARRNAWGPVDRNTTTSSKIRTEPREVWTFTELTPARASRPTHLAHHCAAHLS